jgi:hypothetical protein
MFTIVVGVVSGVIALVIIFDIAVTLLSAVYDGK